MKASAKSWIAIVMGLIILVADVIWTYQSIPVLIWMVLGAIIFVADIVWLAMDISLMKGK